MNDGAGYSGDSCTTRSRLRRCQRNATIGIGVQVYISGGESEAEVLGVGRCRPSVVKPALSKGGKLRCSGGSGRRNGMGEKA